MSQNSNNHISKRSLWIITLCFIVIIAIVPLIQLGKEIYFGEHIAEADIFHGVPTNAKVRAYEKAIEDSSFIARYARLWFQLPLTCLGNQGNSKVVIGRDGWLFYRFSLDYITKPSSSFYRESAPFDAIIDFRDELRSQGVELMLLPIPGKSTIYPEYLSRRYKPNFGSATNIHTKEFFQKLRDKGINVIDPTDILWEQKRASNDDLLYLQQDTHWSPKGMKLVAGYLSDTISKSDWLKGTPKKSYAIQTVDVTRFGDLYDMLNLPKSRSCYKPKTIKVDRVIDAETSKPCRADTGSPIVLLGDSFVNIFSVSDMGWGENAGLGEHLAFDLKTPIDIIALNDGGATGSREQLARRPNALVGKKIVIWQFPTRDLTNPESDWKIIKIPKPKKIEKPKIEKPEPQKAKIEEEKPIETKKEEIKVEKPEIEEPKEKHLTVIGEVILVSNVPDPNQVAYSECLTYIKYRVISVENGKYDDKELIAVFWGMKESKLMPAAKFQIGEKHRLVLDPLDKYGDLLHIMQADDTDDYEHTPYWVLEMSSQ